jgi:hypothetical protein
MRRTRNLILRERLGSEYCNSVLRYCSSSWTDPQLAPQEIRVDAQKSSASVPPVGSPEWQRFVTEWPTMYPHFVDHLKATAAEKDQMATALDGEDGNPDGQPNGNASVGTSDALPDHSPAQAIANRIEAGNEELHTVMIQHRVLFDNRAKLQEARLTEGEGDDADEWLQMS